MPRTLFAKLLANSALVLMALLVAAGFALDRFLVQREVGALEEQLARHARLASLDLPPFGPEVQDLVRRRGEAAGVRLTVMARDGNVLGDSHQDPSLMENHAGRSEVAAALAGQRGRSIRTSPTLGVEMLYVALPGPLIVRAAMPLSEVKPLLWGIRRRVLLAALPALALALGLALLLSRRLTRRFGAMTGFAARLAAGDYSSPVAVQGNDELADLERSLGELREELERQVGALTRDRERLTALVDDLPEGLVVLDADGSVTAANQPARELLRLSAEGVEGLPGAEILREPRILEALDRASEPGQGASSEPFRVSWADPPCDLEVDLQRLPDDRGRPGVLIVLRDVTRQVHLERVRRDFIANLSHELRTPLTAIRGAAETLLDAALSDPEAARRFLDTIRRHSLRLEALLSDVTDLARIEAGAAPPEPKAFDARAPLRHVLELFSTEAEQAGVTLEGHLPEEPLGLVSDPAQVESILVNLVQNAVRYTPEGGRVTVSVEATPRGAVYRVADTGIGIPPRDLPRITERFYRVDPGRSRAGGGTGLGLSIVKHLVEGLGGELSIQSEYEKGTQVSVVVPDRSAGYGSDDIVLDARALKGGKT